MSLDERYQKDLRSMKRLEKSKQLAQKEIGFLREQLVGLYTYHPRMLIGIIITIDDVQLTISSLIPENV